MVPARQAEAKLKHAFLEGQLQGWARLAGLGRISCGATAAAPALAGGYAYAPAALGLVQAPGHRAGWLKT
jgi:hypothetical protein